MAATTCHWDGNVIEGTVKWYIGFGKTGRVQRNTLMARAWRVQRVKHRRVRTALRMGGGEKADGRIDGTIHQNSGLHRGDP